MCFWKLNYQIVHVIIIRSAVSRLYLLHTCMYSCVFEAFGRKPFVRYIFFCIKPIVYNSSFRKFSEVFPPQISCQLWCTGISSRAHNGVDYTIKVLIEVCLLEMCLVHVLVSQFPANLFIHPYSECLVLMLAMSN